MTIQELRNQLPIRTNDNPAADNANGSAFGEFLQSFVQDVNMDQQKSNKMLNRFAEGDSSIEIHDMMVAGEEAKTSLELLMEIRNKTVDMYKELIRLQ